jgi:ABC-2 type transport system ATP-binding protein
MADGIASYGLARRFGRVQAFRDLNLNVPEGEAVGLIGANGAGKSTLLRVLVNLLPPTSGQATVLGADSRTLDASAFTRIGYLAADQALPHVRTIGDLVAWCRPFHPTWDDALTSRLLEVLALDPGQPLRAASRGTRLKAHVVATLAFRPPLLLLDEPLEGLDPLTRDQVVDALLDLMADQGTTVLLASHDLDVLERLLDRVAFLQHGTLLFNERLDDLHRRYRRVEIASAGGHPATRDALAVLHPLDVVQDADRTQFVTPAYVADDTERLLRERWPDATLTVTPLSLREVFVAHARGRA